jgi:hypothetical protein
MACLWHALFTASVAVQGHPSSKLAPPTADAQQPAVGEVVAAGFHQGKMDPAGTRRPLQAPGGTHLQQILFAAVKGPVPPRHTR